MTIAAPAFAADELWIEDNMPAAMEKAKAEGKDILIDFTGSDWCGWCIKLDQEVFSQKAFAEYAAENLVLVKLDFPRQKPISDELKMQNEKLAERFGIRGFPTILLMSPEGELIARTGYQRGGADRYVEHLKGLLAKAE
jgi:thioredoxin-related protein